MGKAIAYFFQMAYAPRHTTQRMLDEPHPLRLGLFYIIGFSFLYSLTALLLYLRGRLPLGPVLPIPPERWYLYQAFYTIPVGLAATAALTALAHGLARWMGGKASWQVSFMLLSLGAVMPWFFFTWIPETIYGLTGWEFPWGATVEALRQIIPAVWQVALCTLALSIAQRIAGWKSLVCVLVGTLVFGLIFGVFIR